MDKHYSRFRKNRPVTDHDIWENDSPESDPILVVSHAVPGLRYVGRMIRRDFHVVFPLLARAAGAENPQLYRNLCIRALTGWQIWKEGFTDRNGRHRSVNCLTFATARSFLEALANEPMSMEDRQRLGKLATAFVSDMPEGTLYPIPRGCRYDIDSLEIPLLPLRAICVDRMLVPVWVHEGEIWLSLNMTCSWFKLHAASLEQFLDKGHGQTFGVAMWHLPGKTREPHPCVPMDRAPQCLLALSSWWRSLRFPCWERALALGKGLENIAREAARADMERANGAPLPPAPLFGHLQGSLVEASAHELEASAWQRQLDNMTSSLKLLERTVKELSLRLHRMEEQGQTSPGTSSALPEGTEPVQTYALPGGVQEKAAPAPGC